MRQIVMIMLLVSTMTVGAVTSSAQVPTIEIYYDKDFNYQSMQCQGVGVLDTLYVVGKGFDTWISTVQYRIDFGGVALTPVNEFMVKGALHLGQCYGNGITITWPMPRAGFSEFLIEKVLVMWQCDDCTGSWDDAISVQPHQGMASIEAVEWQTFNIINAASSSAVACGLVAVEETSWGRIKSLYR